MTKAKVLFPGYRFGPGGRMELFQCAEDVPDGWSRIHPDNRAEPIADKPKPRTATAKRGNA